MTIAFTKKRFNFTLLVRSDDLQFLRLYKNIVLPETKL